MLSAVTDLPEPDSPTIDEHLAPADVEAHPVDGLHDAGVGREARAQVLHRQHDLGIVGGAVDASSPSIAWARRSSSPSSVERRRRCASPLVAIALRTRSSPQLRVERVAQAVADEHERQHGEEDGQAGKNSMWPALVELARPR